MDIPKQMTMTKHLLFLKAFCHAKMAPTLDCFGGVDRQDVDAK